MRIWAYPDPNKTTTSYVFRPFVEAAVSQFTIHKIWIPRLLVVVSIPDPYGFPYTPARVTDA